jgi:hypothetical protein
MGISSWLLGQLAGWQWTFRTITLGSLDAADDFVHITSDTSGVVEVWHKLVFWVDDENGTNGQGQPESSPASIIP